MKRAIAPSLLSADFYDLKHALRMMDEAGVKVLHLDVMDGQFVPNITFGAPLIRKLRPHSALLFDTHLMVKEPAHLLEDFKTAGCDLLTIHWEAVTHIHSAVQKIHALGMKAGISLNPATPATVLESILPELDLVLLMSVNPGFGGQSFIPSSLDKIRQVRKMIDQSGKEIILEVDGGVKHNNIDLVLEAGADWIVAGSAIFGADDVLSEARAFQARMERE